MRTQIRSPEAAGEIIRDLRLEADLSQSDLAQRLGVRQPTISRLERGEGGVAIRLLFDALEELNAQVEISSRRRKRPKLEDIF